MKKDHCERNQAIETLPYAYCRYRMVKDAKGKPADYIFLEVNAAFEQITGLKREKVIGQRVSKILPGRVIDRFDWIGIYGTVAQSEKKISYEQYVKPLKRWYEVKAYSDQAGCFTAVFHDITEIKKADEDLRYYSDKMALLLEASKTLCRKTDAPYQVIVDNITKLTRLKSAAIYLLSNGKLQLEATYPPLPRDFPKHLRIAELSDHPHIHRAVTTRKPVVLADSNTAKLTTQEKEVCEIRKLRSHLYAPLIYHHKSIGVLIVSSVGAIHAFTKEEIGICQTLANFAALVISEFRVSQRLQAMLNNSPSLISELDLNGRYLQANPAHAAVLGLEPSELTGCCLGEVFPSNVGKDFLQRIAQTRATRKPVSAEDSIQVGKHELHLITTFFPLFDLSGQIGSIGAISHDITEIKETKDRLRHALDVYRKGFEGIIQSMGSMLGKRDSYTVSHQKRVAKLATGIAGELGLQEKKITGIRFAAEIHDVGKIAIPSDILAKPGKINDLESKIIQTHPSIGSEILKHVHYPWPLAKIVEQHHEKINGSGYPNGLSGEDILLEARIICVADVVEAMASHRPYRPMLGIDAALEEILENKGILYDPCVVDACLRLFKEKRFAF